MTMATEQNVVAGCFKVSGRVQGVGMRPSVARLAQRLGLAGSVRNCSAGVEIHVEGDAESVGEFEHQLPHTCAGAVVGAIHRAEASFEDLCGFRIECSGTGANLAAAVPVDTAICATCRSEVNDSSDRRLDHPFASCADCGPRYSLIESIPFDRASTSMTEFESCAACAKEFVDSEDRRFHAQVNACPNCGPVLRFESVSKVARGTDAVRTAATAIREGLIVAVKGVGGYQLVCDATSDTAVRRLRKRKRRPTKPLAVMAASFDDVVKFASVENRVCDALRSPGNPIVLLPCRGERLSKSIAPGLNEIGVMLPTTALHLQLLQAAERPCVVTSGNAHGEPLAFEDASARSTLGEIADCWLTHDRQVIRPIDDSVVRVMRDRPVTVRAARGIAPFVLPLRTEHKLLAVGGHQKVAVAVANGSQTVLGPHIGDMTSVTSRERFDQQVRQLTDLYRFTPDVIVHDMHPDYFTTRWAQESGTHTIAVQHHHAHVAAAMLENRWLDREVLGVAFDGTGYGPDGTIWGGEFLLCTATSFRRVARLRPFSLPGGERAVREPFRVRETLLAEAIGERDASGLTTSSVGRLFDGVASMVLGIDRVSYEGEAAMLLEAACDASEAGHYAMPLMQDELFELDWRPLIRGINADMRAGTPLGSIAMKFVRTLSRSVAEVCVRFSQHPVVLTGGCFQNVRLTEATTSLLHSHPQPVSFYSNIPPNDGGLAAGQLAVAAAILDERNREKGAC